MGLGKRRKCKGGQGGRIGHSNMSHWDKTAEIKKAVRKLRRHQDRLTARDPDDGIR
jgi:hypothetical protein